MTASTGRTDQAEAGYSHTNPPPPPNVCSPYFSYIDTGYACILQSSPKVRLRHWSIFLLFLSGIGAHGARKGERS
jgi:hypothetical protein